ncbi:MAG: FGGY family carbohydrate kinase [Anaerolineae bacterium]
MTYLMGIDVGSSDCKVMVTTTEGQVVASSVQSYPTHYPRPGWAEQNPEDWYQAACAAVRGCLAAIDPRDVIGISVDGPAHNVALMDEAGAVLRPTIHWSDLRSKPQADRLDAAHGERIFALTATRANPSWTLAQLLWLKDNQPGHLGAAAQGACHQGLRALSADRRLPDGHVRRHRHAALRPVSRRLVR